MSAKGCCSALTSATSRGSTVDSNNLQRELSNFTPASRRMDFSDS